MGVPLGNPQRLFPWNPLDRPHPWLMCDNPDKSGFVYDAQARRSGCRWSGCSPEVLPVPVSSPTSVMRAPTLFAPYTHPLHPGTPCGPFSTQIWALPSPRPPWSPAARRIQALEWSPHPLAKCPLHSTAWLLLSHQQNLLTSSMPIPVVLSLALPDVD